MASPATSLPHRVAAWRSTPRETPFLRLPLLPGAGTSAAAAIDPIVSSHLLDEIAHMAHEVIVINRGRFVAQSSVEQLSSRASSGSRVHTPQPERLRGVLAGAGIDVTLVAHDELVVRSPSDVVGRIALDAGIPVTGLKEEQQSLEHVFLELTEQA